MGGGGEEEGEKGTEAGDGGEGVGGVSMLYKEVGREVERARVANITNQFLDDKPINHKHHRKTNLNTKAETLGGGGGGGGVV